jgi:hypothetical protein
MVVVDSVRRWAVASNERAVANARAAATECSQRRVERAEADELLTEHALSIAETTTRAVATGR